MLSTRDGSRRPAVPRTGGSTTPGESDDAAAVVPLADLERDSADERLARQRAREIAARLAVARPRRDPRVRRGLGELESVPYRATSDDIDLDRTLDVLARTPMPEDDDIVVGGGARAPPAVVRVGVGWGGV